MTMSREFRSGDVFHYPYSTRSQIPDLGRPRRPVAVKRLRRSYASLRPLRTIALQSPCGDCAAAAWRGAFKSRC